MVPFFFVVAVVVVVVFFNLLIDLSTVCMFLQNKIRNMEY